MITVVPPSSKMDHQRELDLLAAWYHLTLILSLTVPLLYLYIHHHRYEYLFYRKTQIFLCLLTSLANLALYTEAYNLARPIYVCFYPVEGKTFHAPEEARLKIQWILYTLSTCLALIAAVFEGLRGREWSLGKKIERGELLRLLGDDVRFETFEKGKAMPGSWVDVRKVDEEVVGERPDLCCGGRDGILDDSGVLEIKTVEEKEISEEPELQEMSKNIVFLDGAVYMMAAWMVAVFAWLVMYGREKKAAFP
ncbi:hypothetical protein BGZ60DRAFT_423568 [Tricladium varicosporioides]|nr:hypothetical protein BGZ60DRAFT_423568 [Hymenoscyphus varicosporioides]